MQVPEPCKLFDYALHYVRLGWMFKVFKFGGELRFWGDPEMEEAIAAGCPFETRRCVVTALMIG